MADRSATFPAIVDDLTYWLPANSHERRGDDLAVSIDGALLYVSEDVGANRAVVWSELMTLDAQERAAAAEASVRYSEVSYDERGVSVGMAPDGSTLVIGQSVEIDGLIALMLERLLRKIAEEVAAARDVIRARIVTIIATEKAKLAADASEDSVVLRA